MATFTIELWRLIDMRPPSVSEDSWLGLDDYPIFREDLRTPLNIKIKNHFMYQEIGHESSDQFRFALKRKMHEIMPTFNELYKSLEMQYDPFKTIDIHTENVAEQVQTSEGTSDSKTDSDIDANSKTVSSAFPQVQLSGNKDYATSGSDSNSQTKTVGNITESSEAENTTKNSGDSRTSGYQGSPAQLVMQYRAAIINVDMLVISELDDLFMIVWSNGDDYSQNGRNIYYG